MDCNTDLSIIFRPIALGDDNTGASCQAAKKTDDRLFLPAILCFYMLR